MNNQQTHQDPDNTVQGSGGCCCRNKASAGLVNETLVTDPVCGMKVDPATSKHLFDRDGSTFHFCCAGCRTKFAANPDGYPTSRPA